MGIHIVCAAGVESEVGRQCQTPCVAVVASESENAALDEVPTVGLTKVVHAPRVDEGRRGQLSKVVQMSREVEPCAWRRHEPLIKAMKHENVVHKPAAAHEAMVIGHILRTICASRREAQVPQFASVDPSREIREVMHPSWPITRLPCQGSVRVVDEDVANAVEHAKMVP